MKIVFMGTPDFAVPSLHALTEAGYAVAAVVTQPDKPKGRGKTLLPTPVKEEAVMHDIPVYQPEKVRNNPEFLEILKEINPEIIVVAAYGQIIPKEILELPKFGWIPSLSARKIVPGTASVFSVLTLHFHTFRVFPLRNV